MAVTQEFYRNRVRNPRFSTKLTPMSNGMYLTDQTIPEGFARVMVNYDVDDTGSNIRNREGRELLQSVKYPGKHKLGPMHLTDYIYAYNEAGTEVDSIKDLLMTYGKYSKLDLYTNNLVPIPDSLNKAYYVSKIEVTTDDNFYDEEDNIVQVGDVTINEYNNVWALYCDRGSEVFNEVRNEDIGYISARTIKNAYVFDKQIMNDLGKPISTVMGNEVYAFTGVPIKAIIYNTDTERNAFTSLGSAVLSKILLQKKSNEYILKRQVLEPKELNVTEATTSGFNILSESPYIFTDVEGGSPNALGAILYDSQASDIPVFNPVIGNNYALRLYYQYNTAGTDMEWKIRIKDANTDEDYLTLQDWTSFKSGDALWYSFAPTYTRILVLISIREKSNTATESLLPKLIDCSNTEYAKVENKEYDLTTAKGMVNWQGCIGLYGVTGAPDSIFFSDVEDPRYFPFPNNVVTLDNEILAVHKYLDMLLIITTDGVWLLSPGTSIGTSTIKQILSNVFIPELDAINAVVLKDQIFFKTDTRFYVLKPNSYTSDATDLKNFDNSTAIANYTINFTKETLDILNKVYRPITEMRSKELRRSVKFTDFDVLDTQSVVKQSDVHYVYTIVPKIEDKSYGRLNLHLVYDTIVRSFRMYTVGIGEEDVAHSALLYRNKQSGVFYELIARSAEEEAEVGIVKKTNDIVTDDINLLGQPLTPYYNNYQYIDTGYVSLEDTYLKRFREVQFNLLNKEPGTIKFYSDFKVDGQLRISSTEYNVEHITDVEDPDYGLIYVIPESVENLNLYGNTTLEDVLTEEPQYWQIDLSKFPELTVHTVRLQILGKGRRGSIELLNTSLQKFNLSSMVWVYRIMNVR